MKKVLLGVAIAMIVVVAGSVPAHATTVADMLVMIQDLQAENAAQQAQIDSLVAQIGAIDLTGLQQDVTDLQDGLDALDAATDNVQLLNPFVTVTGTALNGVAAPNVILTGVNLHLVDGSGQTYLGGAPFSGHGNLILGYDELPTNVPGPTVPVVGRTGSHCLVLGVGNQWAADAAFVGGAKNIIGPNAVFSFIAAGPLTPTTAPFQVRP